MVGGEVPMSKAASKPSVIAFQPGQTLETWPEFPESEIASGTRAQSGVILFEDKPRGLSAGVWEQGANESQWMTYPVNEWMLVLEGEVVIVEDGRRTAIKAGEAFIIPKGLRCRWTQAGHVKKFFVIFEDASGLENAGPLHTLKMDPDVTLALSQPPSPDILLTPVPIQHTHTCFEDATGQLSIGVWDTTAYTRKLIDFPRHELMHLLEGSVTFIDDKGATRVFEAGDTFFVPLGTPNAWACDGYLRKIFVIFQPK